ncbi:MAG: GTPase Era [Bryobacteraceae bacterium]
MSSSDPKFVSGFVSIVGRPNAGKSTLLNALVGTKLAIVADKPQTTRTSIQGVLTSEEGQVVFLDTPGIHDADSVINRRMMDTVREALQERDLLILVADATRPIDAGDREAVELVKRTGTPCLLALNKIDLVKAKSHLLAPLDGYQQLHEFREYLPVSAKSGEGIAALGKAVMAALPEGPAYFPPDHITDQPERFLAAELIREQILQETRLEVPHSVAVVVDQWTDDKTITRVEATIYVERAGQKGILIGAGGERLKRIGTLARQEMELLLDRRFYLNLFVKVRPKWRENPAFLSSLDWRTMAGSDAP